MNYQTPHLWTALVTPLNTDLTVDYASLKKLIDEQVTAQNGLLILGSTGEALNLSTEDKKQIVEMVLEWKPEVPVMVGVGGHDFPATMEWVKWLNAKDGVEAMLMVTPLYAKPGDEGQYHWFKNLLDTSSKPVMLYNVPGRTGKELSLKAVERLRDHKNFWAIKEASGSVEKFQQYLAACGNKPVFCGDDGLMPEFAAAGSAGLVSVASNTWPAQTNKYVKQCLDRTFDAKALWEKAANALFIASNPVPAKRLLCEQKRISHDTMMPPLSEQDLTDVTPLFEADEAINKWMKEQ